MDFEDDVVEVMRRLPAGDVVSYGEVAEEAGHPGAARAVGNVLHSSGDELPWWRVVNAVGRLAPGKEADQGRRLRNEGVVVSGGRVRPARLRPKGARLRPPMSSSSGR